LVNHNLPQRITGDFPEKSVKKLKVRDRHNRNDSAT